jgi:hypothetical protein
MRLTFLLNTLVRTDHFKQHTLETSFTLKKFNTCLVLKSGISTYCSSVQWFPSLCVFHSNKFTAKTYIHSFLSLVCKCTVCLEKPNIMISLYLSTSELFKLLYNAKNIFTQSYRKTENMILKIWLDIPVQMLRLCSVK